MSDRALFTVVIPTHNYGAYLPTAIDSVVGQDFPDVQVIVVDDASTDDTPRIVRRYGDTISYLRLDRNLGPAGAWAAGLDAARGDYVTKLDADDWHLPGYLRTMTASFEAHPTAGMVATPVYSFYESQGRAQLTPVGAPVGVIGSADFRRRLIERFFFFMPGIALRRAAIKGQAPRDELWMAHDWEYLLRTMNGWACVVLDSPTAIYRVHDASVTRSTERISRRQDDILLLKKLASDPNSELDFDAEEQRLFGFALAETYLRINRLRDGPIDISGVARHLAFARDLMPHSASRARTIKLLARIGALKCRSLLRLHSRRGLIDVENLRPEPVNPPAALPE